MSNQYGRLGLTIAGGIIGSFSGNWMLGASIGSTVGSYLFPDQQNVDNRQQTPQKISGANEGTALPFVFGMQRVAVNAIWKSDFREHDKTKSGKGGPVVTTETNTFSFDVAAIFCPGQIRQVRRIWMNNIVVAEWNGDSWTWLTGYKCESVTVYDGSYTQTADPTMAAALGSASTPAYRGRAMIVFKDLYLDKFNNSVPNIEVEVWAGVPCDGTNLISGDPFGPNLDAYINPGLIVKSLLTQAKIDPTKIDTSDIEDIYILGYSFSGSQTALNMCQELASLLCFDIIEQAGTIVCSKRKNTITWTLTDDDLGVATDGDAPEDPYTIDTMAPADVATKVTITYGDYNNFFQQGTVQARSVAPDAAKTIDLRNPLTSFDVQMKELATTLLHASRIESATIPFTVPVSFMQMTPGDLLSVPLTIDGNPYDALVRVNGITAGSPGHLELKTTLTAYDVYEFFYARFLLQSNPYITRDWQTGDTIKWVDEHTDSNFHYGATVPPNLMIESGFDPSDYVFARTVGIVTLADGPLDWSKMDYVYFDVEAEALGAGYPVLPTGDIKLEWGFWISEDGSTTLGDDSDINNATNRTFLAGMTVCNVISVIGAEHVDGSKMRVKIDLTALDSTQKDAVMRVALRVPVKWKNPMSVPVSPLTLSGTPDPLSGGIGDTPPTLPAPGVTLWKIFDVTAARDVDADYGVIYAGAAGSKSGWTGIEIFGGDTIGFDENQYNPSYNNGAGLTVSSACTIGVAQTLLGVGSPYVRDFANTVTVKLQSGELESVTEDQLLAGANVAIIGSEYVAFETATLVGVSTYQLSGLVRGLRGSEWAIDEHVAGETFLLMDGNVAAAALSQTQLRLSITERPYPISVQLTALPNGEDYVWQFNARMPYSPVHLRGVRAGGGDLTISWIRRARKQGAWVDGEDVPLDETVEQYAVDIIAVDTVTILRTFTVTSATSVVYSAANQTTDFGSPQSSVLVRIYQIGGVVGRGFGAEATL